MFRVLMILKRGCYKLTSFKAWLLSIRYQTWPFQLLLQFASAKHQTRYLSLINFWSSVATCISMSYIHIAKLSVIESSRWHQRHVLRSKTWKRQSFPHPSPPYSTSVVHTHRNLVHCYVNNTSNYNDEVEQVPSVYKVVLRKEN